jgi:glutamate synthase domain-containing protein 3
MRDKAENPMEINAQGIYYKDLNDMIRKAVGSGEENFILRNVNGQRYIADGISKKISMEVYGVPGQDLGAFMKGPRVVVHGNAQDGVGNTMDVGKIVVEGMAGDVVGYGMRGGRIHIKSDVGYRVGIHMKAYQDKIPVIVIGGKAGDFLGEYMAGGVIILLGMFSQDAAKPIAGIFMGTGMHGGVIYVRGEVDPHQLGFGLIPKELDGEDQKSLKMYLKEYCEDLDIDLRKVFSVPFKKVVPFSHRPYGNIYAY